MKRNHKGCWHKCVCVCVLLFVVAGTMSTRCSHCAQTPCQSALAWRVCWALWLLLLLVFPAPRLAAFRAAAAALHCGQFGIVARQHCAHSLHDIANATNQCACGCQPGQRPLLFCGVVCVAQMVSFVRRCVFEQSQTQRKT